MSEKRMTDKERASNLWHAQRLWRTRKAFEDGVEAAFTAIRKEEAEEAAKTLVSVSNMASALLRMAASAADVHIAQLKAENEQLRLELQTKVVQLETEVAELLARTRRQ